MYLRKHAEQGFLIALESNISAGPHRKSCRWYSAQEKEDWEGDDIPGFCKKEIIKTLLHLLQIDPRGLQHANYSICLDDHTRANLQPWVSVCVCD